MTSSGNGQPPAAPPGAGEQELRHTPRHETRAPDGAAHARGDGATGAQDLRAQAPVAVASPRRRLRRWLLMLSGAVALAGAASVIAGVWWFRHYSENLPDVEHLRDGYHPPQASRIAAADGTVLYTDFLQRRTVVPFSEVPDVTKLAFLAAEDAYFYEHPGIRIQSLARALWAIIKAGAKVQGGSTITQQVAEDVLLGHSRALSQKFREWILAYRLEQELTKDEILSLYMNNIYLGHGRYGVEEAARYYFGKRAASLDAAESAVLAGIIASPERYSPRRAPELALQRREYVLRQMRQKGFITPEYHEELRNAPLVLAPIVEERSSLAPEAVQVARRALRRVRKERQQNDSYAIETTIDPRLQAAARDAIQSALSDYADRQGLWPPFVAEKVKRWGKPFRGDPRLHRIYVGVVDSVDDASGVVLVRVGKVLGQVRLQEETRYNPKGLPPSEFTRPGAVLRVRLVDKPSGDAELPRLRLELGPQAALAAVDVRTRGVLALVGSAEGTLGGFDRSTQARRQPGSTFKPFVYGAALHQREVAVSSVLELERKGPGIESDVPPYRISVRSALAHSNNDAAVHLFRLTGPERVVDWARTAGIHSTLRADDSLALGAYEVTPLELANAYATFASGGLYAEPRVVSSIHDGGGALIGPEPAPDPERVMGADEAYLVTSLLQTVVEEGTAEQAKSLGRPIAAKTGTTNDVRDAWLAGYTNDISVAVWIGYDDTLPLGTRESGTRTAGPAFVRFMKAAHQDLPVSDFPRPPGIVSVAIDPETGLLPWPGQTNAVVEVFLDGTAPEINAIHPALLNAARATAAPRSSPAPGGPVAPASTRSPATFGVPVR